MGVYALKNKNNEIIKKTQAVSFEMALEYFSKIKNLPKDDVLKIFIISKL